MTDPRKDAAADKRDAAIAAATREYMSCAGPAADQRKARMKPFDAAIIAAHDAREAEKLAADSEYKITTKAALAKKNGLIAAARAAFAKAVRS